MNEPLNFTVDPSPWEASMVSVYADLALEYAEELFRLATENDELIARVRALEAELVDED